MKLQFNKTPIALALAAMFLSPVAFANGGEGNNNGNSHDPVSIKKDISVEQDVKTEGRVHVNGQIYIDASSMAVVDDKQINGGNDVLNNEATNSATVNGNALNNASGNIGVNVTSGDNNQQANAAAISAADASFVFGSSDAEIFATQAVVGNTTNNQGSTNAATLGGNALANASGNIGVNISAGNNNQQKNDLAASVAVARMATATVQANQLNGGNTTNNTPIHKEEVQWVGVSLALSATGGYTGQGSGRYSGGTTSGQSYQANNIYPDTWGGSVNNGGNHNCCNRTGHIDMDGTTQGAVNNPTRGNDASGTPIGGLAFDNTGGYSGGSLGFSNSGDVALSGTVTGSIPVVVAVNLATTNTSSLGNGALAGASGNVGVNIASGTNNQQFNGLAISATQAHTGGGSGTGLLE